MINRIFELLSQLSSAMSGRTAGPVLDTVLDTRQKLNLNVWTQYDKIRVGKNDEGRTRVMPNIAPGKENFSINAPEGTKYRLEKLRKEVAAQLPELAGHCKDNGTFLRFLIETFWLAREQAEDVEEKVKELNEANEELKKTLEVLREEQLDLIAEFKKLGGTREDLVSLFELIKLAGMKPATLVKLLEQENFPNIYAWLRQLGERIEQRIEEVDRLNATIDSLKKKILVLEAKRSELSSEVMRLEEEMEKAKEAVAVSCGIARDVGIYVDWIRRACEARGVMRVNELMLTPALVIAGAIIEAAATAYGDAEITLMPGPRHPLPMRVTLREISRSIAPPEAYREQAKLEAGIQKN